jgi:hypothetical protein
MRLCSTKCPARSKYHQFPLIMHAHITSSLSQNQRNWRQVPPAPVCWQAMTFFGLRLCVFSPATSPRPKVSANFQSHSSVTQGGVRASGCPGYYDSGYFCTDDSAHPNLYVRSSIELIVSGQSDFNAYKKKWSKKAPKRKKWCRSHYRQYSLPTCISGGKRATMRTRRKKKKKRKTRRKRYVNFGAALRALNVPMSILGASRGENPVSQSQRLSKRS